MNQPPNQDQAIRFHNQGDSLRAQGRFDDAIDAFQRALALNPDSAATCNNLGNALREKKDFPAAIVAYRRALAINPKMIEAWYNLACTYRQTQQMVECVDAFNRGLEVEPNHYACLFDLSGALGMCGRAEEAAEILRRMVGFHPQSEAGWEKLGGECHRSGLIAESINSFRRGLLLNPHHAGLQSGLAFALHLDPAATPQEILRVNKDWYEWQGRPLSSKIVPHENDPSPDRRLRIGYVSNDLHRHPLGKAIEPLIERHDRRNVEVVCFYNGKTVDEVQQRIRAAADEWIEIEGVSHDDVANLVRRRKIDILVDLRLQLGNGRLPVFAVKPAPVQVTWLGYPSTTGLATIDYRLSDPYLDPAGTDEFYAEKTVRLPHTTMVWRWAGGDDPVGPLPAKTRGHITFGSVATPAKINEPLLQTWIQIMNRVGASRLKMRTAEGRTAERIAATFAAGGISPDRLDLSDRIPWKDYVNLFNQQDIALDSFPYSGHTTCLDALWMGVPLVTLAGNTAVGRGGVSVLSNIGMNQLIAQNVEQYVQIAVDLAGNLDRLSEMRQSLRRRIEQSPLRDEIGFARVVEAAYRRMWKTWCESAGKKTA